MHALWMVLVASLSGPLLETTTAKGAHVALRQVEGTGQEKVHRRELFVVLEGELTLRTASPSRPGAWTTTVVTAGEAATVPAGFFRAVQREGKGRGLVLASSASSRDDMPESVKHYTRAQAEKYPIAKGLGTATLLVQQHGPEIPSAGWLELQHGAAVPKHVHAQEEEILYVVSGEVEMKIADKVQRATAGEVIHIPANTPHEARVSSKEPFRAVQFYSPGGPEQRFKNVKAPAP